MSERSSCRPSRGTRSVGWPTRSAPPRRSGTTSRTSPITSPTRRSPAGGWPTDSPPWRPQRRTTTRIDLGTLVASAVIRNPVTLARAAATVDDISGGRLVLGLGAGTAGDAVADRGSAPSTRGLTDRLGDVVGALEAIWAGERDFVGDHAAYGDVVTGPVGPRAGSAVHDDRRARATRFGARSRGTATDGAPTAARQASRLAPGEFWGLLAAQSARARRSGARSATASGPPFGDRSSSATARCNRRQTFRRTSQQWSVRRPPASMRWSCTGPTGTAASGSGRTPTCMRRP